MTKPIIGVLGAGLVNNSSFVPVPVHYCNQAYCKAVEQAGGIPLLLPVLNEISDVDAILSMCRGLLVPGGLDVDPRLYQEDPSPLLGTIDEQTDRFWIHAVQTAMRSGMPVLGICRGLQLVNVALGGTLYQDLSMKNPDHMLHTQRQNRDYLMHQVAIEPDSRLADLLKTTALYTNTMHHQCVKDPGDGLRITARTRDGIPEAMENADGSVMLVQWHPEELCASEPRMQALFRDLVKRAQVYGIHGALTPRS